MWDKLGLLNWFWQYLCEGLSSFNLKGFYYSYAWSCSLCEGRTSFCMGLISRKLCRFLLIVPTGLTSLSILLRFLPSITFFIFMHTGFKLTFQNYIVKKVFKISLVLVSPECLSWLGLKAQKVLKFCTLHTAGKCIFQCKLRYLVRVTQQSNFRMKNVFQ